VAPEVRLPPQDIEAEEAILGAMLMSPDGVDDVLSMMQASHFYKTHNGFIFRAMSDLFEDGHPIDTLTVTNCLDRQNMLEKIGGAFYLTGLAERVPSAANVRAYCRIVVARANERLTISACQRAVEEIYTREISAEEAHATIMATMDKIDPGGDYQSMADIVPEAQAVIESVYKDGRIPGISTGFVDLDKYTGGLQPGDLVILAGRPSMGKTALGMSILKNMASKGHPGANASIESGAQELAIRYLLQSRGNDDKSDYTGGYITKAAMGAIRQEAKILRDLPIYIDDSGAQTLQQIRSRTSRMKSRHDIEILMVDYLQLMSGSKKDSRVQEVGEYSRGLKKIARELDIIVLALSQLNRRPEGRADHRPVMSDLRETGDIEQDADKIIMVYRPEVYKIMVEPKGVNQGRDNTNLAEINLVKHRNGPTGEVTMTFIKKKAQFYDREQFRPDSDAADFTRQAEPVPPEAPAEKPADDETPF